MASEDISPYWKGALGVGYAALIAVNYASLSGKLGRTNASISASYPTEITPANWAFSIWGPIFLLQGAGVGAMMVGGVSPEVAKAVVPSWFATWMFENFWQLQFIRIPAEKPGNGAPKRAHCFRALLSCACFLVAAQTSMLSAGVKLQQSGDVGGSWLQSVTIDFASGLNAGWLAAASGIGIWQALDLFPSGSKTSPRLSQALVCAVSVYGLYGSAAVGVKPIQGFGLGYTAATIWALAGIKASPGTPPQVKSAAAGGTVVAALGGLACLLRT
ncbi:sti1 [Symbiodinium natans]|uniref:Sti1 protein n=1 Tax=Symbiodinium natans TaxID=878477 RepID=A0A812Q7U5_9DINO|nr:sti1 [Symbiodinium natans]